MTMDDYEQAWDYVAREFEYPSALATTPIGRRWAYLATSGLKLDPPTLWMAERDGEFCGFAVTDVAAPERLGPMGVSPEVRKLGVGTVLLKRALADLRDRGVDIGVIYGAGPYAFYARTVNAPSTPSSGACASRCRRCRPSNVSRETLGASRPVLGSLARVAGRGYPHMSASAWAYSNGEIVPLEQARYWPNDLAIIYGEIVYEATRTFGGKPFKLKEHIDRLYRSLSYCRLDPGLTARGADRGHAEGRGAQPSRTCRTAATPGSSTTSPAARTRSSRTWDAATPGLRCWCGRTNWASSTGTAPTRKARTA